jgi:hypothetical protein
VLHMILRTLLFYLTTVYDIKSLILKFKLWTEFIQNWSELTRITHIVISQGIKIYWFKASKIISNIITLFDEGQKGVIGRINLLYKIVKFNIRLDLRYD